MNVHSATEPSSQADGKVRKENRSSELDPLVGSSSLGATDRRHSSATTWVRGLCRPQVRKNKGAMLILMISIAADTGQSSALNQILFLLITNSKSFNTEALSWLMFLAIGTAVPLLLYPLAGWIADARIGRYRVIRISIWCMWLGQCFLSVTFLLYLLLPKATTSTYMKYAITLFIFPLAFVTINVGLAGFQANAMQFGIDQMIESSGDEVSSFIRWYYWSTNFGGATLSMFLRLAVLSDYPLYTLVTGVNVLFMGCSLISWYKLNDWLIIEPHGENPFKMVYDVMRFGWKHKRPIYRSALTYWDDRPLTRLDLGKRKYGGPFTNEEVEDVKSFWAIVIILVSLGAYLISDSSVGSPLYNQLKSHVLLAESQYSDHDLALSASTTVLFLVSIPIYELICPLLNICHCQLTILRRIGIGMVIAVLTNVAFLALNWMSFAKIEDKNSYCFLVNSTLASNASVPAGFIAVPFTLSSLAELVVYIAVFEFICAQSPYRFRGMLIGTFYALTGLCNAVGPIFAVALANGYGNRQWSVHGGCGTVYYSVLLGITVIGLVLYVLVGRTYNPRERDEHIDHHMIAENYYTSSISVNQ